ncbi:MAG: hypothetical protein QGH42_13590 [Kiritimatiellia bacterium]|jgi:hypothetical protein|nr:hypothetical protein [Kiritimatiellia bacterium]MDP6811184.1 hypothetical protein [Kiritimatiellia bacterium]MDP7025258.1 hypothetical protein [Kiritimatiellia bacterium]
MKLKALAESVGKSVPFVMNLQQKYALTPCKVYNEGYVVLVKKLIYLSICSVPLKDIKTLLKRERRLLELLRVDSVQEIPDWFESICVMKSGSARLLLSGFDIGYELEGEIVQIGLDFSSRGRELFGAVQHGSRTSYCGCSGGSTAHAGGRNGTTVNWPRPR